MNTENLKKLVDACFLAKRIVETLPELPQGMKPRHIHVLDAVNEMQTEKGMCRVSDVSRKLNITMPSVTKLIQELETLGMLKKRQAPDDKRVALLYLTDKGMQCVQKHVLDFHSEWAEALGEISDEQAKETVYVIDKLRLAMPGQKKE